MKQLTERQAKAIAYTKLIMGWIPSILKLVCVIAFIPLLMSLTPYIEGSQELETAMTNSQLTAILLVLVLCYGVIAVSKLGKH